MHTHTHNCPQIERSVPLASRFELAEFRAIIARRAKSQLIDSHLWISLFTRPARSRFSRVQRLLCIFGVVTVSMLASAMYYGETDEALDMSAVVAGPFSITNEQVVVGLMSSLLTIPMILIVHLFRKARFFKRRENHVREALKRQHHPYLVSALFKS